MSEFKSLKAGDTVIAHGGGCGRTRSVEIVSRTTRTLIIVNKVRYRRQDGRQFGADAWSMGRITIPMNGEIEAVQNERRRARLVDDFRHKVSWSTLSIDQLEAINEIVHRKQ